jgi:uncharacterized integral membrane protein
MKIIKTIFTIVLLILITIFASQNTLLVTINFFNKSISGSLALLIIVTFLLGFLSGIVFLLPSYIRKHITKNKKKEDSNKDKVLETDKETT